MAFEVIFTIRFRFMATTYKISSDLYDESFGLIALHSSMPVYTTAYFINIALDIKLNRLEEDLKTSSGNFPIFEWYEEATDTDYFLYGNISKEERVADAYGLFSGETTIKANYLLEEKKESDFFLRIDSDFPNLENKTLARIRKIEGISLCYSINIETLKAKQNLII